MNRSSAARALSFSYLLVTLLSSWPLGLWAEAEPAKQKRAAEIQALVDQSKAFQQMPLSEELAELIRIGKEIQQEPLSQEVEDLVRQGREAVSKGLHAAEIQEIVESSKKAIYPSPLDGESWAQKDIWGNELPVKEKTAETSILIFASHSLGKQGLDELLGVASNYPNAVVVFRGIPEGTNLGAGVKKIQKLAAKKNPVPNVVINPTLFEKYGVTDVPSIVLLEPNASAGWDEPKAIASVKGLSDPLWLLEQVKQGVLGDQGNRGNIVAINEPDLTKVMQARALAIDWEEKKRGALARCWKNLPKHRLPTATKRRTREIDPTVVVTQDIVTPDGIVIAREGTKVNPLALRPFTQLVAVFDPLDKTHLARLQKVLPSIQQRSGIQRVTYIATQFCPDKGLDGYNEISDAVDAPVYLLTPDIVERFELQCAPAIIHSSGKRFLVEELADAP